MFEKNGVTKKTRSLSQFNKKRTSSYKSDGSSHSSNLSDSTYFLQRYLGNGYMQSSGNVSTIQKKCDCGGTCTSCSEEEKIMGMQAKSKIGEPDDVYEKEADRVAGQVMRMPDSSLESENEQPNIGISIQRISSAESGFPESKTDIHLNQSGGHRLSQSTREFMEPRFGVDFSDVRLHSDPDAHQTASRINARAFTYGNHIWMGKGESEQNQKLMAHELTHVVQQGSGLSADQINPSTIDNPQIQRDRLPCTSGRAIDVYSVNLPGSTRSIFDDLATANSILCQCGIEINVINGESWDTNLLDMDSPTGVLNESTSVITDEVREMTSHRPGGNILHAYYVPANSLRDRGGSYGYSAMFPSLEPSVSITNIAATDTFAHELSHVFLDDAGHHSDADNLMASGRIRNVGVDELEETQCNRM